MEIQQQINYIRDHLTKPLVLIGMMGAGKTTQARKLAKSLRLEFIDSDQRIEADTGMTVTDIFARHGESRFRELERRKIAETLDQGVSVISVGGGAITQAETLDRILNQSLCIWIDAPVEVLSVRTSASRTRPLLAHGNAEEILTERMAQRRPLYEAAHIHADGAASAEEVTVNLIGQIYDYLLKRKT